jgi:hypothetical protein
MDAADSAILRRPYARRGDATHNAEQELRP